VASKPKTAHGENSSNNNNRGAVDFSILINKQKEEFKNMMFSSQQ